MASEHPSTSPHGGQSSSDSSAPNSNSKPPTMASSITLPSVLLFNELPAWDSPQVDERCFIYCSQTAGNRARGYSPWCRTVCFRRVFGHEVHDGSYDASNDVNGALKPQAPLPLPHEGQPPEAFDDGEVGETEKTQYWKEGRYIWVSKSRWAAQEKLDSMMNDLPQQTAWMRHKEAQERQNYEDTMERLRQRVRQNNQRQAGVPEFDQEGGEGGSLHNPVDDYQTYEDPDALPSTQSNIRYAPTHPTRDSYLFRVTPLPFLIQDALHQKLTFALTPAYKLLTMLGRSFTEGTQTRFLQKAYEQATNGSTLTLMRNVWSRHETWLKQLEEQQKVDDRKKKGGGSEVDSGDRQL